MNTLRIHRLYRLAACLCLGLLVSCACLSSTPAATKQPTFLSTTAITLTLGQPASTPSPTPLLFMELQSADDLFPDGFFQLTQGFRDLESGTYLLLGGRAISIDGIDRGYIGRYTPEMDDFIGGGFQAVLTADPEDPQYLVARAKVSPFTIGGVEEYALTEMLIENISLRTGAQRVWRALFHPESGWICSRIHLSPDARWVTGNCQKDGESSLYMIDLEQGTVTSLHSAHHPCLSTTRSDTRWVYYNWSPDGAWLSASCYDGSHIVITCLVSPDTGEFYCSESEVQYQVKAWSPDGARVAIYLPSEEGYDLLITDRSCLQDTQACPEYLREVISDSSDRSRALGGVTWDAGGETVYWSTYPMDYTTAGYATIWIADLVTGTVDHLDAPRGVNVLGLSPDGNWFVLSSDEGWMLLSRNGQTLRRLSTEIDYYDYLGWLVIP